MYRKKIDWSINLIKNIQNQFWKCYLHFFRFLIKPNHQKEVSVDLKIPQNKRRHTTFCII